MERSKINLKPYRTASFGMPFLPLQVLISSHRYFTRMVLNCSCRLFLFQQFVDSALINSVRLPVKWTKVEILSSLHIIILVK